MNVNFENLELIPMLLAKMEVMEARMAKIAPKISSKKDVARFLKKSERTINNYISCGWLIDGYHFTRENNGKMLVFDESAILEFRDKLNKGIVYEKVAI